MGIEYRLRFTASDGDAVPSILRRLPGSREADPAAAMFEVGEAGGGWPEAVVQVEPGGLYFRDNCGGGGRTVLGELVARLAAAFGAVTVEEL